MARGKVKKTPTLPASPPVPGDGSRLAWALCCLALGSALCAASVQSILGSSVASGGLASHGLMNRIDNWVSGEVPTGSGEPLLPPFAPIFLIMAGASLISWLVGSYWIARRRRLPFTTAAARWGLSGWLWWVAGGSWEVVRLLVGLIGPESQLFVLSSASFWIATGVAGWLATFLTLIFVPSMSSEEEATSGTSEPGESDELCPSERRVADDYRIPLAVWLCCGAYLIVFVVMNWQLYRGLRLPHGDSAMYEEHLWNLLHDKGFRSYLDQGIFLGEHVQVIHLLLIPLYLLWPSQMLLELCDSALLAASCIPVYWIARRHTGLSRPAVWLAGACLLYFPLQYLDIAIDLKTFRPNGLAIPILLFALDQFERRRFKTFCLLAAVALSAQEDYAVVLAPLGVWIALSATRRTALGGPSGAEGTALADGTSLSNASTPQRATSIKVNWPLFAFGGGLAVFSVAYLIVATRVVMAYFRHGQEIHYASYFAKFGKTLPEIAQTMAMHPTRLWEAFVNAHSAEYALMLLAPLGFLPLFSPGRLAVALPLFLTLCLNEVIDSPLHHVHAAAVPILLWAAAAGLGTVSRGRLGIGRFVGQKKSDPVPGVVATRVGWWGRFAAVSALMTGLFYGLSPLSIGFWDPDSGFYWRELYVVGKRGELFERVSSQIPQNARVASTDFVHPRFTHFERSYDYSDYPRAVNNYQPGVPSDTDYIVIDTQHPYSKIKHPDQMPEYRDHPDQWELLPDTTEGFFIVLKRKQAAAAH
ncbi:MAG TPA: DUF2079 domain-containing protein [Planctomycetaceae bacterium]|jgi:uncharacterized membrane protein|nr:DUF2079 domain-containing protein [Planctomycetaceae bacterium]